MCFQSQRKVVIISIRLIQTWIPLTTFRPAILDRGAGSTPAPGTAVSKSAALSDGCATPTPTPCYHNPRRTPAKSEKPGYVTISKASYTKLYMKIKDFSGTFQHHINFFQ